MDISTLSIFKTAAETENFTKAARILNISQPALSYSIKQLQEELGVPLFTYTGRGVKLNTYGKIYLEHVTDALASLDAGRDKLHTLASVSRGTIRISCLYSMGVNLLPYIIKDFRKMYPEVNIKLSQFPTSLQLEMLLRGDEIDLCFCTDFDTQEVPGTEKTLILIEDLYLLVNKEHRLARYNEVSLKEIDNEDFIAFNRLTHFQRQLDVTLNKIGVHPNIVFESNEDSSVAAFVTAGLGIAIIPPVIGVDFSKCKALRISYPVCQRRLCMAWRSALQMTPVLENFKNFIIGWLPKDKKYVSPLYEGNRKKYS